MITPIDIENKQFRKEMLGYSQKEVEDFLVTLGEDYERIYKDNAASRERIDMLTDAIKQYKSMEETLKNALLVAQSAGEELKREAEKQSSKIIKEAEAKAQRIITEAGNEVTKISYQYEEIKRNTELFKAKMLDLLNSQLDILKGFPSDSNETVKTVAEPVKPPQAPAVEAPVIKKDMSITQILDNVTKLTESLPKVDLNIRVLDDFD